MAKLMVNLIWTCMETSLLDSLAQSTVMYRKTRKMEVSMKLAHISYVMESLSKERLKLESRQAIQIGIAQMQTQKTSGGTEK